jgi:hypothetical protein
MKFVLLCNSTTHDQIFEMKKRLKKLRVNMNRFLCGDNGENKESKLYSWSPVIILMVYRR